MVSADDEAEQVLLVRLRVRLHPPQQATENACYPNHGIDILLWGQ